MGVECKCLLSWLWYVKDFIRFINLYEDFYKDSMALLIFSMQRLILSPSPSLPARMVGHLKKADLAVRSRQFRGIKIMNLRRTLEEPLTHWLFLLDRMVLIVSHPLFNWL